MVRTPKCPHPITVMFEQVILVGLDPALDDLPQLCDVIRGSLGEVAPSQLLERLPGQRHRLRLLGVIVEGEEGASLVWLATEGAQ